jgi:hypothetical protein
VARLTPAEVLAHPKAHPWTQRSILRVEALREKPGC